MGLFSETKIVDDEIFGEIKKLLDSAQKDEEVFLVTPYVKFDEKIRDKIAETLRRRVKITLLVRTGVERNAEDAHFLANSDVNVWEMDLLHAKLYWTQTQVVISSMNLYDFSDRKSKEIALVTDENKHVNASKAIIDKWMTKAHKLSNVELAARAVGAKGFGTLSSTVPGSPVSAGSRTVEQGHCIVCKETIPLNGERPLCGAHFDSLKNRLQDYQGHYCHRCGKQHSSKHLQPLCSDCWVKMGRPKYALQGKR